MDSYPEGIQTCYTKYESRKIHFFLFFFGNSYVSLYISGWPWTLRSTCILSAEIKDVCHHVQLEIYFFPLWRWSLSYRAQVYIDASWQDYRYKPLHLASLLLTSRIAVCLSNLQVIESVTICHNSNSKLAKYIIMYACIRHTCIHVSYTSQALRCHYYLQWQYNF